MITYSLIDGNGVACSYELAHIQGHLECRICNSGIDYGADAGIEVSFWIKEHAHSAAEVQEVVKKLDRGET